MIKTEIGFTTPDTITVRGRNLATEILGKLDFVDMILLTAASRLPTPQEKAMINLILVTSADHGLTPSAIATRLTYLGAPEALQGAVAAGLLGAGSVLLGASSNAAEMLQRGAEGLDDSASDDTVRDAARALFERLRAEKKPVVGFGHKIHVDGDPRVPVLREVSRENGCYGVHWRLADALAVVINEGRARKLPMNAVVASGAILADMRLDPLLGRGLALVGRCAGLVGHVIEDRQHPIGQQVWDLVLEQDERNVR